MGEKTQNKTNSSKVSQTGDIERLGWGVRHIQVACMCMCVTALLMVRSSMGVAVLAMTDEKRKNESITIYDWDKSTQGVILSSFFWGYTLMQIPAGILAKRFGGKPILLFAILANGIVCLLIPLLASVGGWQVVCAARVVIGLTQACTFPGSHTLLGRWLPDQERTLLSGIVYGGTQLGTILGMPISGLLAGSSVGWPLVFYAMAALMAVTAILWHWLTASTPAQHRLMTSREREYIQRNLNTAQDERHVRTPWSAILKSRGVWALVICHVGVAYGFVMFFVDMPTYLEKGLKLSLRDSAILSALPYIGMWAGCVVSTAMCEKLFNKGYLSAAACRKTFNSIAIVGLSAGLIGLGFIGPENAMFAVVILVISVSVSGFSLAGFMVNHLDLSPNYAGLLMSLTNFIANMGSIVNPILTSFILQNDPTDLSRWRIVFLVVAGISLSTNLIYVKFGSSDRQPWDDPNFLDKDTADPEEMKPVINEDKEKEANPPR